MKLYVGDIVTLGTTEYKVIKVLPTGYVHVLNCASGTFWRGDNEQGYSPEILKIKKRVVKKEISYEV